MSSSKRGKRGKKRSRPKESSYFPSSEDTARRGEGGTFSKHFVSCALNDTFPWTGCYTKGAKEALQGCPYFVSGSEGCGVRHLCSRGCYYFSYEPSRKWHVLQSKLKERRRSPKLLQGWSAKLHNSSGCGAAGGDEADDERVLTGWSVSFVSPGGEKYSTVQQVLQALSSSSTSALKHEGPSPLKKMRDAQQSQLLGDGADHNSGPWTALGGEAPKATSREEWTCYSPYGLLEEILARDPWKLLLSCILLNHTTRRQVDPVLSRLLLRYPTAHDLAAVSSEEELDELQQLIMRLGLAPKRAPAIVRFSREYLGEWERPKELHWIGKYGQDAYDIFEQRKYHPKDVEPQDHALNWYIDWLRMMEQAQHNAYCIALEAKLP